MDIESYIQEAIFGENEQHTCFYQLIWDTFKESGFAYYRRGRPRN